MSNEDAARKSAFPWSGWVRASWHAPRKFVGRAKKRLLWGLSSMRLVRDAKRRGTASLARLKRPWLGNVTFIGVTGSCAKTTTCIFIKAILLPDDAWQRGSAQNVAEAVLKADPA